jgi:putative Holliday junction resolvase
MILGIDPGTRRIGLAVADTETRFARPLEVIDVREGDVVARIKEIVSEMGITRVVVGRPVNLAGKEGPAMDDHRTFLVHLRGALDVEVDAYDERMTSVIAERSLRAAGTSAAKRKEVRDAVAAQVMLQGYMDAHS